MLAVGAHPTWDEYKNTYGYNFNGAADAQAEAVYNANLGIIDEQNAKNSGFTLGVNQYTMYTTAEFIQTFTGEADNDENGGELPKLESQAPVAELASDVDWSTDS